jgi:predicted PhzF superfamily epimerase YddE/YHI9
MVQLHTVAAFTRSPFGGNLAGVCLLEGPAPEEWMQAMAANVNLSETAFLHREGGAWRLRWFTPTREVPLCGHATLASAHVLTGLGEAGPFRFDTQRGRLACAAAPGGAFRLDFPADPVVPGAAVPFDAATLWEALGGRGELAGVTPAGGNVLAAFASAREVVSLRPDFARLRALPGDLGVIATAPAADGDGYVCRYFAPAWGIDEDPATGSIQCTLVPHWSATMGPGPLRVRQLSRRGAEMTVRAVGDRVHITGHAVTVSSGRLSAAARPPTAPLAMV